MKIVNDYWVSYSDMQPGDVFKFMEKYYMQVRVDRPGAFEYIAIDLRTGISKEIDGNEFVQPIASEIHVGA